MAWVRMTGGSAKKDTNLLSDRWTVTFLNNDLTTTNVLTDTLVSMTIKSASTTSNRASEAYLTSPIFDVTKMSTLILRGGTYKTNPMTTNNSYNPKVYLVNASTGAKTQIYIHPTTAANSGGTISLAYDVSSLVGNYYIQGVINSYGNTSLPTYAGAYIKFIEASLQK